MFKIFKSRSILSLLLVFAMTLSLLPGTAFATDTDTGEHIHTEDCSHEEESLEESEDSSEETSSTEETSEDSTPSEEVSEDTTPAEEPSTEGTSEEEVPEEPVPEEEVTQPVYSGTVGVSSVLWSFNPANGQMIITGNGGCDTFRSADDQPWAHLRTEIREVWFNTPDALSISNLAYWFDGCTALYAAEIPYTTLVIGERAFANCPNLEELKLYYYDEDNFEIAPSAFVSNTKVNMRVSLITEQQLATHKVVAYDWENCNREVYFFDVYSILPLPSCGIGNCTCTEDCDWYYSHTPIDAYEHQEWVRCAGCNGHFALHYDIDKKRLDPAGAAKILELFGPERTSFVLAANIQDKSWDGRITDSNKEWAKQFAVPQDDTAWGTKRYRQYLITSHPGLLDLFTKQVQKKLEQLQEQKPSVLGQLKTQSPRTSPKFSAKSKEQER